MTRPCLYPCFDIVYSKCIFFLSYAPAAAPVYIVSFLVSLSRIWVMAGKIPQAWVEFWMGWVSMEFDLENVVRILACFRH